MTAHKTGTDKQVHRYISVSNITNVNQKFMANDGMNSPISKKKKKIVECKYRNIKSDIRNFVDGLPLEKKQQKLKDSHCCSRMYNTRYG